MDIGIGIPNTVLDAPGQLLIEWARRAQERGFTTLATIGRIAYPGHDELVALAAAAGAAERIGLFTDILLGPAFPTATLAKQTATLASVSRGRFTLGAGVGARPDDFAAADASFEDRGRRFDEQLEALHAAWRGEPLPGTDHRVAPPLSDGRVPMMFGGQPRFAAPRAVRWNGGYTIGGAPAEQAAGAAEEFRRLYAHLGGSGTPRIAALAYFSVGDEHTEESLRSLRSYYAFLGDWANMIAEGAARTTDGLRSRMRAYEDAGIDELVFDPTVANVDQVDRLADVVLG